MSEELLYEKILYENPEKGFQLRLVVNSFRDIEYIHVRKYFMSYDEGYLPSKEGISIPASIPVIYALLSGLTEICAKAEALEIINQYGKDLSNEQTT
jgi:hypothetical protein